MTATYLSAVRASRSVADAIDREWLLTDGLGGFACSTVPGINTRREHGLYVPDLDAPNGRHVLLSRLQLSLPQCDDAPLYGGYESATEGIVSAHQPWLRDFRLEHHAPVWRFEGGGRQLLQRVVLTHDPSVAYFELRLIAGPAVAVQLRPFFAVRRIDEAFGTHARAGYRDTALSFGRALTCTRTGARCEYGLLRPPEAFREDPVLVEQVLYRTERDRGYDHTGAESSPGCYAFDLDTERPARFVVTTLTLTSLDTSVDRIERHERRARSLLELASADARGASPEPLVLAADQFLIRPRGRRVDSGSTDVDPDEPRSVIAGYPWFGDWGRDTMISLPGLALVTGRAEEAARILRTYATWVRDGLLPNLFREGESEGRYDTADATLWFFHAIDSYERATGDAELVGDLFAGLASIIQQHIDGTRFGIGVDASDGLLRASAPDHALTWMDAKYQGHVVTPRRGKPVEIQALWYNALRLMSRWSRAAHAPHDPWKELAARVHASFNARFWNPRRECLYDVVDGEHGNDDACRPNQIFAVALPYAVLDESRWALVVGCVERELLTPCGLRTLSRDHRDYKSRYAGNLAARDAAYHQGTVWPWLLGPFVDAWLRVHRDAAAARALLEPLIGHLGDACIGSVSEVFDAEPPHTPGGCIAQAWSVAELLRARTLVQRLAEARNDG